MVKDRLKSRHRLFNDFPRVKSLFGPSTSSCKVVLLEGKGSVLLALEGACRKRTVQMESLRSGEVGTRWGPGGDHGPRLCRAKRLEDG